jgi:hypothetical protein
MLEGGCCGSRRPCAPYRLGLALQFIGGALGKAACGWLGQYLGVVWSVIATEVATASLIMATLILPLAPVPVVWRRSPTAPLPIIPAVPWVSWPRL